MNIGFLEKRDSTLIRMKESGTVSFFYLQGKEIEIVVK
jgi:hypothetical protein